MYVSRRGIYYCLSESPYTVTWGDLKFYFSSRRYKNNFIEELPHVKNRIENEFTRKFKIKCDMHYSAMIKTYMTIEKRGFYAVVGGVEVTCPDQLTLYGTKLHAKHSHDRLSVLTQS